MKFYAGKYMYNVPADFIQNEFQARIHLVDYDLDNGFYAWKRDQFQKRQEELSKIIAESLFVKK